METRVTRRASALGGIWACRWPLAAGAAVAAGALDPQPALWDAVTQEAVAFERTIPLAYVAGAPLFGLWDTLSLAAASQHYAVVGGLAALYVLGRTLAALRRRLRRGAGAGRSRLRGTVLETARAAGALLLLVAFYAGGALLSRPMTGIELADPDLLAVDFHSHTHHSHDGRRFLGDFTAARNRAWHAAAGFHAAFVTDHYTWAGVVVALPRNPARAGDRTVLLGAAELRLRDRHVNALGDSSRYAFALDEAGQRLQGDSLAAAYRRDARPPTILYALPGPLADVVAFSPAQPAGVVGIEINDGSPRGLEQSRGQRDAIAALADSLDLAVVAGTNLHGWGRTAPAWSVMRIPGWRAMTPSGLAAAIEGKLHADRRSSVAVVERRMPHHDGSARSIAATLPTLLWEHFRMLAPAERVSWLAWIVAWAAVAGRVHGRRRTAPDAPVDDAG